jgi:hypothetical protein
MYLRLSLPVLLAAAVPASAGQPQGAIDPLSFFEGRTEGEGTIKVIMRKPFRSRSIGQGRIERDGSLTLVQRVHEGDEPVKERRWSVCKTGANRYTAQMSDADGPMTIDKVGDSFRFRFKLKGGLSAEQWMTPQLGGKSATNRMTIRKLGMTVATSTGSVRKI